MSVGISGLCSDSDLDAAISLYQELFLLMANNKTDEWVYHKSFSKNHNPRGYHLVGALAPLIMFYTTTMTILN